MRHRRGETRSDAAAFAAAIAQLLGAGGRPVNSYSATATGASPSADYSTAVPPPSRWALQVVGVGGAPTAWDVYLQWSLDGSNWTNMLRHTNTVDANGDTVGTEDWSFPAAYIRINVVGLTLGAASSISALVRAAT